LAIAFSAADRSARPAPTIQQDEECGINDDIAWLTKKTGGIAMHYPSKKSILAGVLSLFALAFIICGVNNQALSADSPISGHGQLQVIGNKLCDSLGKPFAVHGMSLHWSNWDTGFYNSSVVQWLRDDWKCTVVRAAMGIEPAGAYLTNPIAQKQKVTTVVNAAINLGMYVIINWHDYHAHQHTAEAKAFFGEMAQKYGGYPNVIYEIYNEPENVNWATVKAYAEEVIAAIRMYDPDNIVIVGTPNWSQYVDVAADNPIQQKNIMYALHFYAATHKQWLRDKAVYAMGKGIALFVSEWGAVNANGDGAVDYAESDIWIDFMSKNNLSWCNWSVSDMAESSAALQSGASKSGGWPVNMMKPSGAYVRGKLLDLAKGPTLTPTPTSVITPTPTPTPTRTPTPAAGAGYSVSYSVQNDWGNGVIVNVTIVNNTATAVNGWTLVWNYSGNQTISALWNGTFTQSGVTVTVKNMPYNAVIPAGGSVSFEFNLTYSGSNPMPAEFTLNGAVCTTL
jgi:endoglucanase